MYTIVFGGFSDGLYLNGDRVVSGTIIDRVGLSFDALINKSDAEIAALAPRIIAAVERWLKS